jgi:hypothetical protein
MHAAPCFQYLKYKNNEDICDTYNSNHIEFSRRLPPSRPLSIFTRLLVALDVASASFWTSSLKPSLDEYSLLQRHNFDY